MSNIEKGLRRARAALHSIGGPGFAELPPCRCPTSALRALRPSRRRRPSAPAFEIERLEWVQPDIDLLEQNRIVIDERSNASAAYKVLRTRVLQRMRRNGWKTLAVTGTCPNEGKTLTAINLSINLAWHLTTSVVLVDMDLRNPVGPSLSRRRHAVRPHGLLERRRAARARRRAPRHRAARRHPERPPRRECLRALVGARDGSRSSRRSSAATTASRSSICRRCSPATTFWRLRRSSTPC